MKPKVARSHVLRKSYSCSARECENPYYKANVDVRTAPTTTTWVL